MTFDELDLLLRTWQRRLGLDLWRIELVVDRLRWAEQVRSRGEGFDATVWRSSDYDTARVYLDPAAAEGWSPTEAADYIVHELVHLALRELDVVADLVEPLVSRDAFDLLHASYLHALESTVDRLARQLVALDAELDEQRPRRGAPGRVDHGEQ